MDTDMSPRAITISVVVPVHQEEASIRPFLARLIPTLEKLGTYEVLFCVDPSSDGTLAVIETEIAQNPRLGALVLSRRFGQPAVTMAGILHCKGDCCAVIDVDLQDPPELIGEMHAKLRDGYEVVYGKRLSRAGESMPRLATTYIGYKVINMLADVDVPRDTGDFRIMSRRVIEELRQLKEAHGFLRGMVAFVGFKQTHIAYQRGPRVHGRGHYNRYVGSIKIGLDGLLGYSNSLLHGSLIAGATFGGIGALLGLWVAWAKLVLAVPEAMTALALTAVALFVGGVQLFAIGVVGEYVGRIYNEVKRRPMYIVDRVLGSAANPRNQSNKNDNLMQQHEVNRRTPSY